MNTFREMVLNEASNILDAITIKDSRIIKDYEGFIPNSVDGLVTDKVLKSIWWYVKAGRDIKQIIDNEPNTDPKDIKTIVSAFKKVSPKFKELIDDMKIKGIDTFFTVSFDISPGYSSYLTKSNMQAIFKNYEVKDVVSSRVYGNVIYICILKSKKPTTVQDVYKNSISNFEKFLKTNKIELNSNSEYIYLRTMVKSFDSSVERRESLIKYLDNNLKNLYSYDLANCDEVKNSSLHVKSLTKK